MSKKITHEKAREGLLQVYVYNDIHTNEANYVLIRDYITQQEKQEKLLELYKQAYDKSNAEVLKMFTMKQDEKTTLNNIIGHLDDSKTVVQIKELEK
jgi:DNA-binding transcriptional regulator YbjK